MWSSVRYPGIVQTHRIKLTFKTEAETRSQLKLTLIHLITFRLLTLLLNGLENVLSPDMFIEVFQVKN